MRRSKKCFGLLLASPIMLGLSLSVYSNTNALRHDYKGVSLLQPQFPNKFKVVDGRKVIDWDYDYNGDFGQFYTPPYAFQIIIGGDSEIDYSDYNFKKNMSFMSTSYDGSQCDFGGVISPILDSSLSPSSANFYVNNTFNYMFDDIKGFTYNSSAVVTSHCKHRNPFNTKNQPAFDNSSLPNPVNTMACGLNNGAVCGGLWSTSNFIKTQMLPNYWFTSDGFWIASTTINPNNGITYSHSTSFSDMFNKPVNSIKRLFLPLYSFDDFWITASNFYEGREVSFYGSFAFDNRPEFLANTTPNAYMKVSLISDVGTQDLDCSSRVTGVNEQFIFNYECSGRLEYDSAYMYPILLMNSGDSPYFFKTDGDWRFSTQFFVTDNDFTKGEDFNEDLHGNDIVGDAKDFLPSSENADWWSSFLNLFHFDVIFPFSGLYTMFQDQPCVEIPTIAGMLHSEQTTYCAWFDSTTRSIVTPVMSIASVMLVFGFFVRWLKGSSSEVLVFDEEVK